MAVLAIALGLVLGILPIPGLSQVLDAAGRGIAAAAAERVGPLVAEAPSGQWVVVAVAVASPGLVAALLALVGAAARRGLGLALAAGTAASLAGFAVFPGLPALLLAAACALVAVASAAVGTLARVTAAGLATALSAHVAAGTILAARSGQLPPVLGDVQLTALQELHGLGAVLVTLVAAGLCLVACTAGIRAALRS